MYSRASFARAFPVDFYEVWLEHLHQVHHPHHPGGFRHRRPRRRRTFLTTLELFSDIDLGVRDPGGDGCVAPIGLRVRRPRVRRMRSPSAAALVLELHQLMERQHGDLLDELRRLGRYQRDERESLPALLRRVTEIERVLKLTELHLPARTSRRRPMGMT
jgi:hypothetical protein